jgi:DUF971 family protein
MKPIRIARSNESDLSILWDDERQFQMPLKVLRDRCPCASCSGETVLFKKFLPKSQPEREGKYTLTAAQTVGSYAVNLVWGDGHATGIYSWELLRSICELPSTTAPPV